MITRQRSVPAPVMRFTFAAAAAITVTAWGISAASASVCFDPVGPCTTGTETSVNLNSGSDVQTGTGLAGTTTVDFSSTDFVDLSSGNATITPASKGHATSYSDLTITTPGFTFTDFEYSLQMVKGAKGVPLGFAVSAFDGSTLLGSDLYTGLAHDSLLDFAVTSTTPITKIVLSDSTGFKEAKLFDFSGLTKVTGGPPPSTPLPAALPLFGSVLGGAGFFGWRRKRKARAQFAA